MAVLGLFFGCFQDFFQAVFWGSFWLLPVVAVWVPVGGLLVCGVCFLGAFFSACLLKTLRLCVVFGAVFGG